MLPSFKKTHSTAIKVPSKREEKKEINISWNSALFFQIGIIASLMITFLVMEATIGHGATQDLGHEFEFPEEPAVHKYVLAKPNVVKPTYTKIKTPIEPEKPTNTDYKITDNGSPLDETPTTNSEQPPIKPTIPDITVPAGPKTMITVEQVPVFPGCDSFGSNFEKTKCMSDKINAFISKRFRTDEMDVDSDQTHRIYVQFTIDKSGNVTNLKARAPHTQLEQEAKRVVGKLPKMIPGKQGNHNVDVIYAVPIIFKSL